MKKILLFLSLAACCIPGTNGQQRLSLYEEFSGENCGPCATSNPAFLNFTNANAAKIFLIKYQSPIPSDGPIYNKYTSVTDARMAYYSVVSAPTGRINGNGLGSGTAGTAGHIANLRQSDIDAAYNAGSPFNITAVHSWSVTGDTLSATINITAVMAYAPAGANLKLRVALIESLEFCMPPGSNGEKSFHHVVREMYPDPAGTAIPNSWTNGQTATFTVKGRAPQWVDKSDPDAYVVVWVQNDADKFIAQAAKSTHINLTKDAALTGCTPSTLSCGTATTGNVINKVTLKNTGTTALTTATIFYRADAAAFTPYNWSGSLAPGASTTVNTPVINLPLGYHLITDSITSSNGTAEINKGNNVLSTGVTVINATMNTLPVTTDFENNGLVPPNWTFIDENQNGDNYKISYAFNHPNVGHNNSKYMLLFESYRYGIGEVNYAVLPTANLPAGAKTLDFWIAHRQLTHFYSDTLDIVYSTDCGANWTSIWRQAGQDLATLPGYSTAAYYWPDQTDWKLRSVNVSAVPAGAQIAFREYAAYDNNTLIDDVNLRAGVPNGVENIPEASSLNVFPNPATAAARLKFTLNNDTRVKVMVYDVTGRLVSSVADELLKKGEHSYMINTLSFAAGLYHLKVETEQGAQTIPLSVIK